MNVSFNYYFDNEDYAEEDEKGNYYWHNDSGFLEDDEEYDDYCKSIDSYIIDDPFDDVDNKYLSFTKAICDCIVKKLSRPGDKHCEYIIRHFDSIMYSDGDGKREAMRYIYKFVWQNYKYYTDNGDPDYYFGVKAFYVFTKNYFLKKTLENDFKVSLFGNISIKRKTPVDVEKMIEESMKCE